MFDRFKKRKTDDNSKSELIKLFTKFNEYYQKGDYLEAIQYAEELNDVTLKVFGKHHKEYGRTLNNIATLYSLVGRYGEALSLFEDAKGIIKDTLGTNNREYTMILNGLANTYQSIGRYDEALPLFEEAEGIIKENMDTNNREYTMILNGLANTYQRMGRYDEALNLYNKSKKIRFSLFGKSNEYAVSLHHLAIIYMEMGKYDEALPLFEEAKEIIKEIQGTKNYEYTAILHEQANLYESMGRFDEALNLYNESKEIRIQIFGKNNQFYINILQRIANLYHTIGQFDSSLILYRESEEIIKQSPNKKNPDYALSLHNIALFYQDIGRYDEALPLFVEAKEIIKITSGTNNYEYAVILNGLANFYQDIGKNDEALKIYQEAFDIYKRPGMENPLYANILNDFGLLYFKMGMFEKALPLYVEAKDIRVSLHGKNHLKYAESLSNIALLYQALGKFDESLPLYIESREILGNLLGKDNPKYGKSLKNLAILYMQMSRFLEAFNLFKEVFLIDIKLISEVFSISSEKQRTKFLEKINFSLDGFLSLVSGYLKNDDDAVRFAAEVVLSWKGLELETSMAENELILAGEHLEFADKFQELRLLRDKHVQLLLAGHDKINSENYKKIIKDLKNKIELLESDLAINIPEMHLKKRLEKADIDVITHNIPQGSVLVDFIKYNFIQVNKPPELRYLAFILKSKDPNDIIMVDLGEAGIIDNEIWNLRKKTTGEDIRGLNEDINSSGPLDKFYKLDSLILNNILKVVEKNYNNLLISPDSDLSLLPFEILPFNDGYLIDNYEINYINTGRDLLRLNKEYGDISNPIVMVDPDFDYNEKNGIEKSDTRVRSHLSRDFNREKMEFEQLPGTRLEGDKISKILDSSKPLVFMGSEAVESRLKKSKSPWIIHLATHGFFLPDQELSSNNPEENWGLRFIGPGMENPLIRSGVAFAGANRHLDDLPDDAEDGIFTAEEASGLNLLNTELVVLSACETGLGKVKRGEGVFGLRRAFVLAGARTLVMSLWKVDDLATSILMERFYQNLINEHMGRNQALKEAQQYLRKVTIGELRETWLSKEVIEESPKKFQMNLKRLAKKPDEFRQFKHPLFWGAFICQGDPSPLNNTKRHEN